jgi:hypothetical protein
MINIGVEVRKRENELPLLKRIDGVPRVLVAIILLFFGIGRSSGAFSGN